MGCIACLLSQRMQKLRMRVRERLQSTILTFSKCFTTVLGNKWFKLHILENCLNCATLNICLKFHSVIFGVTAIVATNVVSGWWRAIEGACKPFFCVLNKLAELDTHSLCESSLKRHSQAESPFDDCLHKMPFELSHKLCIYSFPILISGRRHLKSLWSGLFLCF